MGHNADQGLAADRPAAYLGNKDLFWFSTDTEELSFSDGDEWISLGGGGSGGRTGGGFVATSTGIVADVPDSSSPTSILDEGDLELVVTAANDGGYWAHVTYNAPGFQVANAGNSELMEIVAVLLGNTVDTVTLPSAYTRQVQDPMVGLLGAVVPPASLSYGFVMNPGQSETLSLSAMLSVNTDTGTDPFGLTQITPASIVVTLTPVLV